MISLHHPDAVVAFRDLAGFRKAFHGRFTARADALFELTDVALSAEGPMTSLVELSWPLSAASECRARRGRSQSRDSQSTQTGSRRQG